LAIPNPSYFLSRQSKKIFYHTFTTKMLVVEPSSRYLL
jgi:hypothetical protein